MTVQDLVVTLRQGRPITARLVREIITHLERIPALYRTIKAMDHDFAQLSVAYSAVTSRMESTVPFARDECGYVENALEECERLKEAVRWERECRGVWTWLNNTLSNVRADLEIQRSTLAASKAVENLL